MDLRGINFDKVTLPGLQQGIINYMEEHKLQKFPLYNQRHNVEVWCLWDGKKFEMMRIY